MKKLTPIFFACIFLVNWNCRKTEINYPGCGEGFELSNKEYEHLGFRPRYLDGSTSRVYKICEEGLFISLSNFKNYNDFLDIPVNAFDKETYVQTTYAYFSETLGPYYGAFEIDDNYTVVTSSFGQSSFFEIYPMDLKFNSPARITLEFSLYHTNDCWNCTRNVKMDSLTILKVDPNTRTVLEEMPGALAYMQDNPSFQELNGKMGIVEVEINTGGCYVLGARRK